MKEKHKYILTIGIMLITFVLVISKLCFTNDTNKITDMPVPTDLNVSENNETRPLNVLVPEEMREDLMKLKNDLLNVHPSTIDGLPEDLDAEFDNALKKIDKPMEIRYFHSIIAELLSYFNDSHTSSDNMRYSLPINFKIIDNKFYVIDGINVEAGDRLLSIGGIDIDRIYKESLKIISAENIYWANNIFERSGLNKNILEKLGAALVDNNTINIQLMRNENLIEATLPFLGNNFNYYDTKYEEYTRGPDRNANFMYLLDKEESYVHFVLRSCEYSDSYKDFLEIMFRDLKENNIENIVIDLRENVGGSTNAIEEFMRYLDIEEYTMYDEIDVRISEDTKEQRGYEERIGLYESGKINPIKNDRIKGSNFNGDLYLLVSNETFSSATTFASTVRRNNLGLIIGQPTGGAPSCYGDVILFQLENSLIQYTISHKKFIVDIKDSKITLYPDYWIDYSVDDYIEGRDLEMEKVMELIENK